MFALVNDLKSVILSFFYILELIRTPVCLDYPTYYNITYIIMSSKYHLELLSYHLAFTRHMTLFIYPIVLYKPIRYGGLSALSIISKTIYLHVSSLTSLIYLQCLLHRCCVLNNAIILWPFHIEITFSDYCLMHIIEAKDTECLLSSFNQLWPYYI